MKDGLVDRAEVLRIIQEARESGETDLRSIRALVEYLPAATPSATPSFGDTDLAMGGHVNANGVAAIITRHLAVTAEPKPESSDASWRLWFDRMGDKASAAVVNATADLVTNERLAALTQADVLPVPETPVGGEAQKCVKCGHGNVNGNNGMCIEFIIPRNSNSGHRCGCKCEFPAPVHAAGDDEDER